MEGFSHHYPSPDDAGDYRRLRAGFCAVGGPVLYQRPDGRGKNHVAGQPYQKRIAQRPQLAHGSGAQHGDDGGYPVADLSLQTGIR